MKLRRLIARFIIVTFVMLFMALSSLVFARQMLVRQGRHSASAQTGVTHRGV